MIASTLPRLLPLAAVLVLPAAAARPKLLAREPSWMPAEMTCHGGAAPTATAANQPASPPATTEAPDMAETLAQMELMKRVFTTGPDTCGYYYDDSIYKCDAGLSCAVSGSIFGCCRGVNCGATSTNFYTYCMDYSEPACVSSTQGYYTLCCTSVNWPYCYTGVSSFSGRTVTHYGCGNNVFTGIQTIVGTPYYATATTSSPFVISTGIQTGTTTPTPAPKKDDSSSTPVGAIVGGVVGGLAVIGLIVFLLFWFVFRKKPAQQPQTGATPQMAYAGGAPYDPNNPSMQQQQPMVTGYPPTGNPGSPPPPSYIDPRFSAMYGGGAYPPNGANNGGVVNGKDLWSPTSTVAPMLQEQNTGGAPGSGPASPGINGGNGSPSPSPNPGQDPVVSHDMTGNSGNGVIQPQATGMSGYSAVGPLPPPQSLAQPQPPMGGQSAQSHMSLYGGPSPQPPNMYGVVPQPGGVYQQHNVYEAPATNPTGMGNNRAELG